MAYSRIIKNPVTFVQDSVSINGNTPSITNHTVLFPESRIGEKVPDYKQKIRDGVNAASAFTSDRSKLVVNKPGSASLRASFSGHPELILTQAWEGQSTPTSPVPHLSSSTASAEAMALSQLYRKIDSELVRLNSLASLAEFGDVLHQFGHPFESIIDLTNRRLNRLKLESRGLKGTVVFRKIKFAQIVASTYLEYAFGLAPLISDTRKLAESVAQWQYERSEELRRRSKVTGSGISTFSTSDTSTFNAATSTYLAFTSTKKRQTDNRCRYTVGLNNSIHADFGSADRLKQLCGFDPKKFIPAAWEVVPWSWLLDYFTNVGDILQASATNTSAVTWISKSISQKSTEDIMTAFDPKRTLANLTSAGYTGNQSTTGTGAHIQSLRTTVVRTIPPSLGVPPLSFTYPGLTEYGKLANMAAVLISRRSEASSLWLY